MSAPRPLHILVVFTGGTISSRLSGEAFEMSDAPYRLMESIPRDQFIFDPYEPMQTFSENMTPGMLIELFGAISDYVEQSVFDGLIVAHGTDTLAYTAQLADLLLSGLGFPVVILGSKSPLEDPQNDGQSNFMNALDLFTQVDSGVYAVSRSKNGTDYVHPAGRIMQADSQTDDFHSYKGQVFGVMHDGLLDINPGYKPHIPAYNSRELLTRVAALRKKSPDKTVLLLDAGVGMNYSVLNLNRPEFTYILQRLFHSGTACTAPRQSPYSLLYLQNVCREHHKRLFIAPIESERIPYSTTYELLDAGITPVYDLPVEAVWAGLLLCTWLKESPDAFFSK